MLKLLLSAITVAFAVLFWYFTNIYTHTLLYEMVGKFSTFIAVVTFSEKKFRVLMNWKRKAKFYLFLIWHSNNMRCVCSCIFSVPFIWMFINKNTHGYAEKKKLFLIYIHVILIEIKCATSYTSANILICFLKYFLCSML